MTKTLLSLKNIVIQHYEYKCANCQSPNKQLATKLYFFLPAKLQTCSIKGASETKEFPLVELGQLSIC